MPNESVMQLVLERLRDDFGVDIAPAIGLHGQALADWIGQINAASDFEAVSGGTARADGVADRGAWHGCPFFVLSFETGGKHGIDFSRQSLCDRCE